MLVGRDQVIAAIGDALDSRAGHPGRATLYTGARGIGKTVMLNEAEAQARERGWVVVSETASNGLVERLVAEGLPHAARLLDFPDLERRVTGIALPLNLGSVQMHVSPKNRAEAGLRTQVRELTDHLARHDTGLMITVDEIHGGNRDDLRSLGAVVQHCFREDRPVAFVAAGLPSAVKDLLNDDVVTFLRRADRHQLGTVDDADVADALRDPIEGSGRTIDDDALAVAVDGTGGYPFLIQLVGHWIWRTSPAEPVIDLAQATGGLDAARRRMGSLIHEPALYDLSPTDRTFLAAMALDDGPSQMADIAARMNVDANYASQYRLRLIGADMIRAVGHGRVEFAMPYLRDYLREHASSFGI
jgi:type II secretory pathway predicted ATPase ExeA